MKKRTKKLKLRRLWLTIDTDNRLDLLDSLMPSIDDSAWSKLYSSLESSLDESLGPRLYSSLLSRLDEKRKYARKS